MMLGLFLRLFVSIIAFGLMSVLDLGVFYLFQKTGVGNLILPVTSLLFALNILLLVISVLRAITEAIAELSKLSRQRLQSLHQTP